MEDLYKRVIKKFGKENQIERLLEELNELGLAIHKYKRYNCSDVKKMLVCSELADVEILIEQMKLIFPKEIIEKEKAFKLNRLEQDYLKNGDGIEK